MSSSQPPVSKGLRRSTRSSHQGPGRRHSRQPTEGIVEEETLTPQSTNPQVHSFFNQPSSESRFTSATPTIQAEKPVRCYSVNSPFPKQRDIYPLGPLKGLPSGNSDSAYANLEEACLIRHFTDNLAHWVGAYLLLKTLSSLGLRSCSLIPATETVTLD